MYNIVCIAGAVGACRVFVRRSHKLVGDRLGHALSLKSDLQFS